MLCGHICYLVIILCYLDITLCCVIIFYCVMIILFNFLFVYNYFMLCVVSAALYVVKVLRGVPTQDLKQEGDDSLVMVFSYTCICIFL